MNIRTVILTVVLVLILLFAAQLVTAKTEEASNPSPDPVSVINAKERPADQSQAPILMDRSQNGECFDVPIRELTACRDASQASVQADRAPIDECFDVSLWEVASCRKSNQVAAP